MGLCDIHQHVVFGVDDGAKDIEESKMMLTEAFAQGITDIICTSHVTPGYYEFNREKYLSHFAQIVEFAKKNLPELNLYTGTEIMYTSETVNMLKSGCIPTLAGGWHVLVEFMPDVPYDLIRHSVHDFLSIGVTPVIAHFERYACLHKRDNLKDLRREKVLLQMNAGTVLRTTGLLGDRWARSAISKGVVDIIASDAHNTTNRKQNMLEAYRVLEKGWGAETAMLMCHDNAEAILPRAP